MIQANRLSHRAAKRMRRCCSSPRPPPIPICMRVLTIHVPPNQPAGVFELHDTGESVIAPGRETHAALLLFTSATTDSPKLVPLTWWNLQAMTMHDSRALQLTAADRLLSLMPLFHLHGLAAVLTQLSCGGSVICTPGFDQIGRA